MPLRLRAIASAACLVLLAACAKETPPAIDYSGPVADWTAFGAAPADVYAKGVKVRSSSARSTACDQGL